MRFHTNKKYIFDAGLYVDHAKKVTVTINDVLQKVEEIGDGCEVETLSSFVGLANDRLVLPEYCHEVDTWN